MRLNSNDIIRQTLPPDTKKILKIISFLKEKWHKIKSILEKKTDRNSTPDDIDRITEMFIEIKAGFNNKAEEMEEKLSNELAQYVDELRFILEPFTEMLTANGIRTDRFFKKLDRSSDKIKGTFSYSFLKFMSLDNPTCREILKMIPGEKKDKTFKAFICQAAERAIDDCCNAFTSSINEIAEETENDILNSMEAIENQISAIQNTLSEITDNEQMTDSETHIAQAEFIRLLAERTCNILETEV